MSHIKRRAWLSKQNRSHTSSANRRLRCEPLEDRRLLAIFVNNLVDEADGSITDGDISLRDAIALAPAGETIGFVSGGTIDLTLGELVINKDLTISAGTGLQLTIDAQDNSRIFNITGGTVGISGLTLTRGRADFTARSGGALRNQGSLTISSSTITSSYALYSGGGIANLDGGDLTITGSTISENSAGESGGGIFFSGKASTEDSMSIINSTISGNTAEENGGGIYAYAFPSYGTEPAPIEILNSTISGNAAGHGFKGFGFGGGVHLRRALRPVISGSLISNNSATRGGGIFQYAYTELTIADSTISDNTASSENPADLAQGGGVAIARSSSVSITGSTISGNVADGGGGFRNNGHLEVSRSTISDNTAIYSGGGITNLTSSGELTIVESTISGNNVTDNSGPGGGIFNDGGTLNLERSTLSGNSAGGLAPGGGIFNSAGTANVVNSTLSGNSTGFGQGGGGVWNQATLNLRHSTVTDNTGTTVGGILNYTGGTATLSHSIVAGNKASAFVGGAVRDISNQGTIAVDDYNLFGADESSTGSTIDGFTPGATDILATSNGTLPTPLADIIETTLADNDGPTLTHALSAGSPALDAGNPGFTTPPDSDQRGLPYVRASGSRIDIGAFEEQPLTFVVTTLNDENDGGGEFSLREAIELANITPGADSISFDPDLAGGTIHLDPLLGELEITDDVTIVGLGADQLTIDAGGNSRVLDIALNTKANLSSLTIAGGSADNGAGIRTAGNTELILSGMVVTGNSAAQDGGGVYSFSNLTIVDSTISGNTAGDDGGGLWIYNDNENFGERAIVSNSTISGNTATGSGGGVYVDFGEAFIRHSTITQNTAAVGDGLLSRASSLVSTRFRSTIIAENTDDDDVASAGFGFNSILSDGYNLVGGGNANGSFIATGDQSGVFDPHLLPLGNYGGPTPTHALLLGSSAIDAGDPADIAGQGIVRTFDQRRGGFDRIKGAAIDIGAFEQEVVNGLVVDTLEDSLDGDYSPGDVSLRELLEFANDNPGSDTITFSTSLSGGTIELAMGELAITDDLTIVGLGADQLTVDGGGNSRVFSLSVNQTATISGMTITGGRIVGRGGGGIQAAGNSNLTLAATVISGNMAIKDGNFGGDGGGVQSYGRLNLVDSTVSGNTAGDDGGGVWIYTDFFNYGSNVARISNSTISGNSAAAAGGGVFAAEGKTEINFSTITDNTAGAGGGLASVAGNYNRTELRSTIIAGNTDNDDVLIAGLGANPLLSQGFNLVGNGDVAGTFTKPGDQIGVTDPMLGPLADNGGPTPTHLPQEGSAAIDAGDPAAETGVAGVPAYDQRGEAFARVSGTRIDIGAVELQQPSADFDDDGDVDGYDFLTWQRGLGTANAAKADGDADNDVDVDSDDLVVWESQYGQSVSVVAVASLLATTTSEEPQLSLAELEEQSLEARLIDAAMALEWSDEDTATERQSMVLEVDFELMSAPLTSDDSIESTTVFNGSTSESDRSGSNDEIDATEQAWLADELLESVFS